MFFLVATNVIATTESPTNTTATAAYGKVSAVLGAVTLVVVAADAVAADAVAVDAVLEADEPSLAAVLDIVNEADPSEPSRNLTNIVCAPSASWLKYS